MSVDLAGCLSLSLVDLSVSGCLIPRASKDISKFSFFSKITLNSVSFYVEVCEFHGLLPT